MNNRALGTRIEKKIDAFVMLRRIARRALMMPDEREEQRPNAPTHHTPHTKEERKTEKSQPWISNLNHKEKRGWKDPMEQRKKPSCNAREKTC